MTRKRKAGLAVGFNDRLIVRRNPQTGRWSVHRGARAILTGATWETAMVTVGVLVDSDMRVAKGKGRGAVPR